MALLSLAARATATAPVGIFEHHADPGPAGSPGSIVYDAGDQTYTVHASGAHRSADQDECDVAWRTIGGDFILQARLRFAGAGVDPHRRAGIMVRASLDPRSPHVNLSRQGDGLTALQFRRTAGGPTEEVRFEGRDADVLEIARTGGRYRFSVARFGETYTTIEFNEVDLGDRVSAAIFLSAHNNAGAEQAVFSNVRLLRPARPDFIPYREYIGSNLEILDLASGLRRIIHHEKDSLQAPNWTPDGRTLILNRNGRMLRFDLASSQWEWIDTGDEVQCNNDHALSFDGRMLAISSGQPSRVFTLPVGGGTPRLITPIGPSYFHSWSPDGQWLTYTAHRENNWDIYRIPSEGGAEVRLTTDPGLDDGSEYTPDGRWVYFISDRTGRMQIWRMHHDGSGQEQMTFDNFNNWFPHISPDGKSIVFITYGPEIAPADHPWYKHVYLRQMPLDGGPPRVIAYVYGGQGTMNVNSWSPDSRAIAFIGNTDAL